MSGGRPVQFFFPRCLGQARRFLGGLQMFRGDSALPSFILEQCLGFCFGTWIPCSSVTSSSHLISL